RRRHDTGAASSHPGKCRFHRPATSRWLASIPADISCSARVRSAAPSAQMVVWSAGRHPFDEKLLDVPIRKREPQIPTDRANNNVGFEVPPFKQGAEVCASVSSLSDSRARFLATHPSKLLRPSARSTDPISPGQMHSRDLCESCLSQEVPML